MKVGFLHLELGFGGSERLMIDAGVELQARGHTVRMYTARYDPERCFPETRNLDIRVHARTLPESIRGRCRAACSIARMLRLAQIASRDDSDVLVCDLVAHVVPALKRLTRAPVVFYCHYPDRLLAPSGGALHRLYRIPIDRFEVASLKAADRVLVNSRFTADVVRTLGCKTEVLYPGIDASRFSDIAPPAIDCVRVLVVARFDPRKNLSLAVEALHALRQRAPAISGQFRIRIVGALEDHRAHAWNVKRELERQIRDLELGASISIHPNPSDAELLGHFAWSTCVMHTALGEHFGLVPLEAMAAGRPVLAVADAGPLETVVDGETGWLRAPNPDTFARVLETLAQNPALGRQFGTAGRARVLQSFSRSRFGERLEETLGALGTHEGRSTPLRTDLP